MPKENDITSKDTTSRDELARKDCEARGGRWENGKCILPDKVAFSSQQKAGESRKDFEARGDAGLLPSQNKNKGTPQTTVEQSNQAKADLANVLNPQTPQENTPQAVTKEDVTITDETGRETVIPAGTVMSQEQAQALGLNPKSLGQQQGELFLQSAAIAGGATPGAFGAAGFLTSKIDSFFSKFAAGEKTAAAVEKAAAPGSRALGTNPRALGTNPRALVKNSQVLKAPSKLKGLIKGISATNLVLLGSLVGLNFKGITSTALTGNAGRIESEVSKLGEQLTKIPETVRLGFSISEDGKLYEYTPAMALADIEELEQTLIQSERALNNAGIGSTVLKLTGRYNTAQLEIDKQRREIIVARAKVLDAIANPSPNLEHSRELFRGYELDNQE